MLQHIIDSAKLLQPETTLTVTFCVLLLADLFIRRKSNVTGWLALGGLVIAGCFVAEQRGVTSSIFNNMFAVDAFSTFFKFLILLTSGSVIALSLQSNELQSGTRRLGEYYALLMSLTLGMFLMSGASNLLMMYLALELTSLSSYILAGYTKEARDSSEASLKYILYGAVSSGLMLYGISILFGLTGAVDIYGVQNALAHHDVNSLTLVVAGVLIVAGFGYKISAAPFHFWTPDVYEGAPITITAFLAVASKAAGFAMMIRFFTVAFMNVEASRELLGTWTIFRGFEWNHLLAILSVLTMTLGNLAALGQRNLKRLLAYSSIAHAGYMLLGVVVLSSQGLAAVLIYFAVYFFMNIGAFYVVMLVANKTGSEDIDDYNGLGRRSPLIGVAMTIFLLSLTGIPPTAGFVGKLYLFAALINANMIWLAIVGALNSVVSLYYYVRILRNMYLREAASSAEPIRFSILQTTLLLCFVLPIVFFGIYFGPLVEYAQASIGMFGVH